MIVHLYEELWRRVRSKAAGNVRLRALRRARTADCYLARDRLGKKPLHYALHNGRLLFASEIKAILAVAPELAQGESAGAFAIHVFWIHSRSGHRVSIPFRNCLRDICWSSRKGEIRIRQYWDFPQYGTYEPASEEECLEELEFRLAEAVRIRLIADVPLGAMLSGGTDSSTVVALMARASSQPVKTFTIGFRHADFNEAPYARMVAQKFGTDHHELILEPDIARNRRDADSPSGGAVWRFFHAAHVLHFLSGAEACDSCVSGDGGDEAFAGYDRYRIHLEDGRTSGSRDGRGVWYREASIPWFRIECPAVIWHIAFRCRGTERTRGCFHFSRFSGRWACFPTSLWRRIATPLKLFREYLEKAPADDPLSRVLYLDSKTYLPGDILTKVDRMSMATSLEARVPMLDHVFLEWVTALEPRVENARR